MGFLDEKKKSNEEIKKSNEEVKKSYDDMKGVYERLGQKVDRLTVAIEKIAAPSFKQTIESRDRQLLEDVTRQMQNISDELESKTEGLRIVNKNHHTVIYTVFGFAVVIALSCFYMMYEMRQEVKATNEFQSTRPVWGATAKEVTTSLLCHVFMGIPLHKYDFLGT